MIKIKRLWGKTGIAHVRGNADEITVEVLTILQAVYNTLHKENPDAAEAFKNLIAKTFTDPGCPVWNSVEK